MDVWTDFIAGCFGGMAGTFAGHPMDTIKVRQQLNASRMSARRFIELSFRHEGMTGLFKGMSSPFVTAAAVNSVFFGFYGGSLKFFSYISDRDPNIIPTMSMVYWAGTVAGAVQLVLSCPVELVKIKLQMDMGSALNSVGNSHKTSQHYRGPIHCLSVLYKTQGIKSWYKGLVPMFYRDSPSYGIYMVLYEWIMRKGKEYQLSEWAQTALPLFAGGVTGSVTWGLVLPIDVIKSRIQADCPENPRYKSMIQCIRISYNEEGLSVFYRGFGPLILRAVIVNAATFFVYQTVLTHLTA